MESNWKILHSIEEIKLERDFYYNLLREIEKTSYTFTDEENKEAFVNILSYVPEDFKVNSEDK